MCDFWWYSFLLNPLPRMCAFTLPYQLRFYEASAETPVPTAFRCILSSCFRNHKRIYCVSSSEREDRSISPPRIPRGASGSLASYARQTGNSLSSLSCIVDLDPSRTRSTDCYPLWRRLDLTSAPTWRRISL